MIVFMVFYDEKDLVLQQEMDILCGVGIERWSASTMDIEKDMKGSYDPSRDHTQDFN